MSKYNHSHAHTHAHVCLSISAQTSFLTFCSLLFNLCVCVCLQEQAVSVESLLEGHFLVCHADRTPSGQLKIKFERFLPACPVNLVFL